MKKRKKVAFILSILLACSIAICARGTYVFSGERLEKALSSGWELGARPSFQYDGVRYYFREKSVHPKLVSKDIFHLTKLNEENAPSQDKPELLGCSVWALPDNGDALYLRKGGSRYFLFMSAPAWFSWICYDNSFFLYEGHSQTNVGRGLEDRTHLPDAFIPLGTVSFDEADRDRMPHKNMTTNDPWLKNHQAYLDPQNEKELYVEIPNGAYSEGPLVTRYDRYIKTDPKTITEAFAYLPLSQPTA